MVLDRFKLITILRDIPVIILTADELRESERKGLEAGAVALLHKPVQEDALIAAAECVVGGAADSLNGHLVEE